MPGGRDPGGGRPPSPRPGPGSPPLRSCGAAAECAGMSEGNGTKPMVIVGGGFAGGNAAAALRDEGFGGRVVIIGPEPGVPFGRPPLSKTYLRSEERLQDWYVRQAGWYEE